MRTTRHGDSSTRNALFAAAMVIGPLSACDSNPISKLKLYELGPSFGISDAQPDPSVVSISADATVPILLSSNKPDTTFTVNGRSLSPAKTLKVMVPRARLQVAAQAPCYRALVQTAEESGFGPSSLFEFTFANWDRDAAGAGCR
jgi:hypothetical protein